MTRTSREFSITITVREVKRGEKTPKIFESVHRCSYVLARAVDNDERYLGPYLCTELAKSFADACVTLVADPEIV